MKIRPPVKGRWPYIRADDGVRTRDLNLGKVPRYQLRYVRISNFPPKYEKIASAEGEIYPNSGVTAKGVIRLGRELRDRPL